MKPTALEASEIIERFLDGASGAYEWDDFESIPIADSFLNRIRLVCLGVHDAYPAPPGSGLFCNDEGMALMRAIAAHLKSAQ